MSLKNKRFVAKMAVVHRYTGVITEPGYIPDVSHCTEDELMLLVDMGAIAVAEADYVEPPKKRYNKNGTFIGYEAVEVAATEPVAPAAKPRKSVKSIKESEV